MLCLSRESFVTHLIFALFSAFLWSHNPLTSHTPSPTTHTGTDSELLFSVFPGTLISSHNSASSPFGLRQQQPVCTSPVHPDVVP